MKRCISHCFAAEGVDCTVCREWRRRICGIRYQALRFNTKDQLIVHILQEDEQYESEHEILVVLSL